MHGSYIKNRSTKGSQSKKSYRLSRIPIGVSETLVKYVTCKDNKRGRPSVSVEDALYKKRGVRGQIYQQYHPKKYV